MMFKIMKGFAPPTLSQMFPRNQSKYTDNILIRKPRIDLYKTSLSYSGGYLWNSLPKPLTQMKTITSFKTEYKKMLFKKIEKRDTATYQP